MSLDLVRHRRALDAVRKYERREASLILALQAIANGPPKDAEEWEPELFAEHVLEELRAGKYDTGIARIA